MHALTCGDFHAVDQPAHAPRPRAVLADIPGHAVFRIQIEVRIAGLRRIPEGDGRYLIMEERDSRDIATDKDVGGEATRTGTRTEAEPGHADHRRKRAGAAS